MKDNLIVEEKFDSKDYTSQGLERGVYEQCTFHDCNFSNSDLSLFRFLECEFIECNMSMAKLGSTAFQGVHFENCKMLGLRFDHCDTFGFEVSFEICVLNLSSFYRTKMKKTDFNKCTLHEVDFAECDLSGATFDYCDLHRTIFDQSILEQVDFRLAYNYIIDPSKNRMKKAKFSTSGIKGLLEGYNIIIE